MVKLGFQTKFSLFSYAFLFLLLMGVLTACNGAGRKDPLGASSSSSGGGSGGGGGGGGGGAVPTPTHTPLPDYVIYRAGAVLPGGQWLDKTALFMNTRGVVSTQPVFDNVNGDGATLEVRPGTGNCGVSTGSVSFDVCACGSGCTGSSLAQNYIAHNGRIAFNLMLGTVPGNLNGLRVEWGGGANCGYYMILDPSDFTNTFFTAVDIPLSTFHPYCGVYTGHGTTNAFTISATWNTTAGPVAFYINDIRWIN